MKSGEGTKQEKGEVVMTTKVQKWGNSLAVRIPSQIAEQLQIRQGSEMEIVVANGAITFRPKKKKPALDELLAKVTPENRHNEIDLGVEGNELI
ncbi:multidrug transporter MatE [Caldalkalibacillus thermarum]|uniref:AbrB/MazE/SpoVT family DNA-binding domain-containing protein n=1 Tax=Caldalkalibacillus thermarum TaxID=296745 RepID=UPI0016659176|nr:AbrB/MazE/SpoVT family DNA-binding domain-containing protein [Caldalkalibacillus thermarum]GGK25621.1 multidrug transporter MatE [Caldalkalibacillus thermarum]